MNCIRTYKGFFSLIKYSKQDNCFYGKLENANTNDLVSFEGNDINGVTKSFEEACDYYIDFSEALNKEQYKKYYCYNCDAYRKISFEYRNNELNFEKINTKIKLKYLSAICNKCNNEIYISEIDDDKISSLNKLFETIKECVE